MSKYSNPIDAFAENPQMTPLLDIAGEWHELFDSGDYRSATRELEKLRTTAMELLGSDAEEVAKFWAARAMGVTGLARASVNRGNRGNNDD